MVRMTNKAAAAGPHHIQNNDWTNRLVSARSGSRASSSDPTFQLLKDRGGGGGGGVQPQLRA